jgi:hypothetical protein
LECRDSFEICLYTLTPSPEGIKKPPPKKGSKKSPLGREFMGG